jgi:hypothetical protein
VKGPKGPVVYDEVEEANGRGRVDREAVSLAVLNPLPALLYKREID